MFDSDEDDDLLFDDEEDEEEELVDEHEETWKVMVVDDEQAVHDVTRVAIGNVSYANKSLKFIDAYSGEEAKQLILEHPDTALILLDVVMEHDNSGLEVARYIREEAKNYFVRIVLRTGQPGQAPETEIILNYDINDYKEKTELTKQKLLTTVISCLRSYHDVMMVEKSRFLLEQNEHALKLAKRSAETANKAKSVFLSKMSHELLTPLNAIIGYSEVLLEEANDLGLDDFLPDIQKIHQAGEHLNILYKSILNISKIEADKLEIHPEHFEVVMLINEVVKSVTPTIEKNNNTLKIECPSDMGKMYTDRNMVCQILSCLLNNAGKFTHQGEVVLNIQNQQENGIDVIVFSVLDTGIGINTNQLNNIFQPFKQIDDSTTREYDGAGLGLVIVKSYCETLGGNIFVNSKVGKGSSFTIHIPINILDTVQ